MSDFLDVKLAHMIEDAAARRAADLVPLVTALDRITLLETHLRRVLEIGNQVAGYVPDADWLSTWDQAASDAKGILPPKQSPTAAEHR